MEFILWRLTFPCALGVELVSKNEYQDIPGGKGDRGVEVTTLPPSCVECLVNWSLNRPAPSGPHRPVIGGCFYVLPECNFWRTDMKLNIFWICRYSFGARFVYLRITAMVCFGARSVNFTRAAP